MEPKKIVIACQGGGSHTAFTAGVLKTFLRELDQERYPILGLSGTSGGAICATLAWYGLLAKDTQKAIDALDGFWRDNSATHLFDAIINNVVIWSQTLRHSISLPEFNPYLFPPIGQEKLAEILEAHLPFDAFPTLINPNSPQLMVSAVNVLTGEFTIFKNNEVTVDALLASAAIPTLFQAVYIGENIYWDGLFSQNPPFQEFIRDSETLGQKPDEVWIIRINPQTAIKEPTSLAKIMDRRNELSGNLSLSQEIAFANTVNKWLEKGLLSNKHFKHIALRTISLDMDLDSSTKLDRSPEFIQALMDIGEEKASLFLSELPEEERQLTPNKVVA